jgi:predicted  nucleic acid-binding Zn-ribbon protein
MHPIIAQLVELERIESLLESAPAADTAERLAKKAKVLRAEIPAPILAHYDRLEAGGKVGIAPVLNGCCQGCHLSISTGARAELRDKSDVHVCEHCGRYIYPPRPEPSEAVTDSPPASKASIRSTKKRARSTKMALAAQP